MIEKVYVHSGMFHADDVAVVALMQILNPAVEWERVNVAPSVCGQDELVADIGGGKYDHHQDDTPIRKDGFKHSAASLVWEEYGPEIVRTVSAIHHFPDSEVEAIVARFDAMVLRSIVTIDNGYELSATDYENQVLGGNDVFSLSTMVSQFNPNWDCSLPADVMFTLAVKFVNGIFRRTLERLVSTSAASQQVQKFLNQAEDRRLLVMKRFLPWQGTVIKNSPETVMVIFPSARGGYNLQLAPEKLGDRNTKMRFPKKWMEGDKPEGMTFIHKAGFMAAFDSEDNAVKAAKSLLEHK